MGRVVLSIIEDTSGGTTRWSAVDADADEGYGANAAQHAATISWPPPPSSAFAGATSRPASASSRRSRSMPTAASPGTASGAAPATSSTCAPRWTSGSCSRTAPPSARSRRGITCRSRSRCCASSPRRPAADDACRNARRRGGTRVRVHRAPRRRGRPAMSAPADPAERPPRRGHRGARAVVARPAPRRDAAPDRPRRPAGRRYAVLRRRRHRRALQRPGHAARAGLGLHRRSARG